MDPLGTLPNIHLGYVVELKQRFHLSSCLSKYIQGGSEMDPKVGGSDGSLLRGYTPRCNPKTLDTYQPPTFVIGILCSDVGY